MEDGNGVPPEDGKFLMPTFLFVELMENRKSTLEAGPADSPQWVWSLLRCL